MDEIADTQRAYVKARLKAQKIKNPKLKKKADELLEKLFRLT